MNSIAMDKATSMPALPVLTETAAVFPACIADATCNDDQWSETKHQ